MAESEALEQVPLLHDLPPEARAWLGDVLQPQDFASGAVILRQGEPGTGLYVMRSGRVQVLMEWDAAESRGQIVLATLGPGEVFGELAPLDGGPRTATVLALEPVTAWYLPQQALDALLDRNPHVGRMLFRLLVQRMRLTDVRVAQEARDPLTGLANRSVLAEFFERQVLALQPHGGKIALVLLDLNGLKRINDIGGHEAGDRALAMLAQALQDSIRGTDLAVRYGGDEFVLALPGADAAAAEQVVDRVRTRLADSHRPAISFSHGVAAAESAADAPLPLLKELLARADAKLYHMKVQRRGNQA